MEITRRYTLLAFFLLLSLYMLTPSVRADTLSYNISGTLGDGDSPIEITFGADQRWPAIQNEKMENDLLERSLVTSYYRPSTLFAGSTHRSGFLRCIARIGSSPLVGTSLVLIRITLAERWPLLVTIAVILAVLLYMEVLIRRHRGFTTKLAYPRGERHFSGTLRSGTMESPKKSGNPRDPSVDTAGEIRYHNP
jgi:hypothetical protein